MNPLRALEASAERGLMPPGSTILLAVSGGADSMALLAGTAELSRTFAWRLSVAHVHHGWRGRDAERDLSFVSGHAARLCLPFFSRRRDARAEAVHLRLSPEAAGRAVRYQALLEMAAESGSDLIATAHQREDRAESLLLALERRAGIAGLAGPRARREDGVVRPLLKVSRAEILEFLARRGICFRRDRTNGDLRLSRNRARRAIARLRARAGEEAIEALARCAETFAAERDRLEEELRREILPCFSAAGDSVATDARRLSAISPALLRAALEKAAARFARRGRPPLTGRERETLVARLRSGGDFRFEAGRRIRFERRGPILTIGLR